MPAAIKEWWRNLKLQLENELDYRMNKRAGGMRWFKSELMAAHADAFRLERELESAKAAINAQREAAGDDPLQTALKLLRIIDDICVDHVIYPAAHGPIQMYELRSWRDDYWQFKIHGLKKPGSKGDEDNFGGSSYRGTIGITRVKK